MSRVLRIAALATLGIFGLANANETSSGSAAAGKTKSVTCAACHGPDGNSVSPQWPSLAGQHSKYTYQQLIAFQKKLREDPLMSSMAVGLSDEDMRDLAAYYEAQPAGVLTIADPKLLERGRALYIGGNSENATTACIACHGPNGSGNPAAAYPSISAQHATYVAKSLRDYASGARKSDAQQIMRSISAKLSEDDIKALASYVQGLQ